MKGVTKLTTTYDAFKFWGFPPEDYAAVDTLALEEPTLAAMDAPERIMARLNVPYEYAGNLLAAWADRAWIAKGGTVNRIR